MKNRFQILLAAALAFTATSVFAADCGTKKGCEKSCPTNKTHFTPRSHGVNLALEKTAGWPNLMNRKDQEDAFGGNLQAVFFMMHSTSEDELARYFLFPSAVATAAAKATTTASANSCKPCDKPCGSDCATVILPRAATAQSVTFGTGTASTAPTGYTASAAQAAGATGNVYTTDAQGDGSTSDLDLGFLMHNYNTGGADLSTAPAPVPATVTRADTPAYSSPFPLTGPVAGDPVATTASGVTPVVAPTTLKLCPEHKAIGVKFDYHQDLKCLLKGMYLELHVPVAHVENSLGVETAGAEAAELLKFVQGTRTEIKKCEEVEGAHNAFKNLTAAKMSPCKRSETGVADIDLMLGYKFNKCGWNAALNLGVTIPTGNTPDAEYVFDAVVGNGGHVGFGFGLDAHGKLWKSEDCDHSLTMNFAMNYRYLFRDRECRTLGICNENFGQYMLLIDRTLQPSAQQLTPAANVTTLRVDVTPGSQFDGIVSFNYNWCGFALDLGYNLFLRSHEKVKLACASKCGTKTNAFVDGKWAIATRNADMCDDLGTFNPSVTNPMTVADQPDHIHRIVNEADLDRSAAETPSLTSHKLFVGLGYWTKDWEVPVLVGVGGHFEWADDDLISNWGFNARLGVAF